MHSRVFKWIAVGLVLAPAMAGATATLNGMVSLNRERGASVADVTIYAQGANPISTGNDGLFVLLFPQGLPGQDVRVRVQHAGWEVVNDVLLDHRLPGDANARPLEIIICRAAERERWVAEFYRLKGNQAVEQSYRVKLAELEGRQATTAQERDRLLRERDQALSQVHEWARQAATLKPDDIGGAYWDALRLFLDSKTDAALALLSEGRLEQEVQRALTQLDQAVQGWLLKGQLLGTKLDFDGASRAYEQAVRFAPESYGTWFRYAYFHREVNRFAQARRGYEQALTLARQASNDADIARALNNLGLMSIDENRSAEARKQYEEALQIHRTLAKTNPNDYLPNVAATLNNLGILSNVEKRYADARKQYEEALKIYRSLGKGGSDLYSADIARTLNNLGALSRSESRNTEARQHYEEALQIRRSLAEITPDVYLSDVASTLNNLGVLNSFENRRVEARKQYEEALKIRRLLVKKNPDVYLPDVATTLHNLGTLSSDESRNADARQQYEEGLEIYRSLAKKSPDVYLPYVAVTLNNLGLLSSVENRKAEANQQLMESLSIYRKFAAVEPTVYELEVRRVEQNISRVNE